MLRTLQVVEPLPTMSGCQQQRDRRPSQSDTAARNSSKTDVPPSWCHPDNVGKGLPNYADSARWTFATTISPAAEGIGRQPTQFIIRRHDGGRSSRMHSTDQVMAKIRLPISPSHPDNVGKGLPTNGRA
jgi:hypothetical protein